jgi:hypothetical protein
MHRRLTQTPYKSLLIITGHLRRRFGQLNLVAHLLEARSERFNSLLLLGYDRLLLRRTRL